MSDVQNKILDNSKYITTLEFDKLKKENFAARSRQTDLVTKTDVDNKLTSFNKQVKQNK